VVTGIVAVATGFIELIKIDMDSPLYRRANRHMMLATTTWCCYAASLSVGFEANATRSPGVFGLCLSAVGFGMLCLTGFLGGKLVYEHGLGVQGRTLLGPSRTAQRKS
ncbi:DUF2231 domain-containing protein, partial [Oleiagrimonas sp. MCCC 1A03011]|uniref:DUF2231 domain-containing protein n=1 Tax=Oleiagrimonas sp. MCCC 1A03011 TaxID=1926883 RepID=UPI000DC3F73D